MSCRELDRVRCGFDEHLDSLRQILNALEEAPFVKETMVDGYVQTPARTGREEAVESVPLHESKRYLARGLGAFRVCEPSDLSVTTMRKLFCLIPLLLFVACLGIAQDATRKIAPLDKLKVTCAEESLITKTYKVSKDGMILVDFLGAVDVQGLTEKEAADKLSQKLVADRILRNATVTVAVVGGSSDTGTTKPVEQGTTDPTKTTQPTETKPLVVHVTGALGHAGDTEFKDGLKLSDVLKGASPTSDADLAKVKVTSADGTVTEVDARDPAGDVTLKAGDTVSVPELVKPQPFEVTVLGGVKKPGAVTLLGQGTVAQAIEQAGGFTPLAAKKRVRVERDGQELQTLDFSAPGTDLVLRANDRVMVDVVEQRSFVEVQGAVRNPGFFVVEDGMKLSQLIAAAGGILPKGRADRVQVTSGTEKPREVNFMDIEQGFMGDVPIRPGDKVVVPGPKGPNVAPFRVAGGFAAFMLLFNR